jgi:hypothetical protein
MWLVFSQNPTVPFFDPYNHDFTNSNAVADCHAGVGYSGGWTALHAAAEAADAGPHGKKRQVKGDLGEMRFLLKGRGHHVPPEISFPHVSSPHIDTNVAMTKSKYTPLHIAVRAGHVEASNELLKEGALSDAPDSMARTPLHLAAELGHTACLQLLLKQGKTAGELRVRLNRAQIATLNGPNVSPRQRQGMEVWAEVSISNPETVRDATQKTPLQVDTMNPVWNSLLVFRCCERNASLTVTLKYRHGGLTKKQNDLALGVFSCTVQQLAESKSTNSVTVPLESLAKVKEREEREREKAASATAAAGAVNRIPSGSAATLSRIPSGASSGAINRAPSGSVKRIPSGGIARVKSTGSAPSASHNSKLSLGTAHLKGAASAVMTENGIPRSVPQGGQEEKEEKEEVVVEEEELVDTVSLSCEFHPLINMVRLFLLRAAHPRPSHTSSLRTHTRVA